MNRVRRHVRRARMLIPGGNRFLAKLRCVRRTRRNFEGVVMAGDESPGHIDERRLLWNIPSRLWIIS